MARRIKLSAYAKEMDISYITAFRWFQADKIPHKTMQTPSGSIYVYVEDENDHISSGNKKEVYIYARVSIYNQKEDLERQVERLTNYAISNGYIIKDVTKEIASGLNQNRKGLIKLLKNTEANTILVEHVDRFSRFGFNLMKETLNAYGRNIIVVNETESEMDTVQDFIDVVTCMCARIYGKRSAKNKSEKIKNIIEEVDVNEDIH